MSSKDADLRLIDLDDDPDEDEVGRDEPTTLYRLLDADGSLLYVGIAGNPGRRFEQHAKDKPWWGDVDSIRLQHFPSRSDAVEAEGKAIRSENPRHNIAMTTHVGGRRARQERARTPFVSPMTVAGAQKRTMPRHPHGGGCHFTPGCATGLGSIHPPGRHYNCSDPDGCCCTCHD